MKTLFFCTFIALLAVSACTSSTSSTSETAPLTTAAGEVASPQSTRASLAASTLTRLTLAYSTTSAANSPLQLAQDRGLFHNNGLDLELVHAPGNAGPAAVLSGQAQILLSGCAEAISAVAGGADLVFLLTSINRMQYMLAGGPSISNREDIPGKRLAVSRIGASSHLATKFIIKYLGLDPDQDVTYVQVGNTPERVSALLAGSVDGTILSADEGTLIGHQPGMRILVDMTTEDIPYCGNALVAARQYTRNNPDLVRRITQSLVEAIVRFKINPKEGIEAVSRFLDEPDLQKAERLWKTWARMFPDKPYPDARGLQFVIDEMAQADARARTLTPEQLVDPTWIRELDQSGFIDNLVRTTGAS